MKQLELAPISRTPGIEPLPMDVAWRGDAAEVIIGGRQIAVEPAGLGDYVGRINVLDQESDTGLPPMSHVIGSLMNRFVVNRPDYRSPAGFEVMTYAGDAETASYDEPDVVRTARYAVGPQGELDDWGTYNYPLALWTPGKNGRFPWHGKHIGYRGRHNPGQSRIHDDHGGFDTNRNGRYFSLLHNYKVGTDADRAPVADGQQALKDRTTLFITKAGIVRALTEEFHVSLQNAGMPNGLRDVTLPFDFSKDVQAEPFPGAYELGVAPLAAAPTPLLVRHHGDWSFIYNLPRCGEKTNITDKKLEVDLIAMMTGMLLDPERRYVVPQTDAGSQVGWNGKGVSHAANGNPFNDEASMLLRVTGNHFKNKYFKDGQDPRTVMMPNPGRVFTETELDKAATNIAAGLF